MVHDNLSFWSKQWIYSINHLLSEHTVIQPHQFIRYEGGEQQQRLIGMINTIDVLDNRGELGLRLAHIFCQNILLEFVKSPMDEKSFERTIIVSSRAFEPFGLVRRCLYQNEYLTFFLGAKQFQTHSIVFEMYFYVLKYLWSKQLNISLPITIMTIPRNAQRGGAICSEFGGRVRFNEPACKLVLDLSDKYLPGFKKQKEYLRTCYRTSPLNVFKIVEMITRAKIQEGKIPFNFVAKHIPMSTRTLQDKLKLVDQPFRKIKERLLLERCNELLSNSRENLDVLAEKMGFGSASNFCRAYKKWTGLSPADYRRHCGKWQDKPTSKHLVSS